tara:strand:+ start:62 stop:283 length:222 start_codon:yes stop_codon:yes gene_type:complete
MSDTKSGYEIRADLLSQAEGILLSNIDRENYAIAEYNSYQGETAGYKPLLDRKITAAQIIRIATQLNEFVVSK